jgi:tetratricopeptide (TPR) repeat protein
MADTNAVAEGSATIPAGNQPRVILPGALIFLASFALIAGCWSAGFTAYDDTAHVLENRQLAAGLKETLALAGNSTYFPVTILSYRLDQALFDAWLPGLLGSIAPGMRFMTLFYHAAAALLVWRVMLRLRLSAGAAFFVALVFAAHPLACETVCWISERKNALAALFGFAALLAWLAGDEPRRWWRVPAAVALYVLALLSKPSALGLLPVFVFLELFGGAAGLAGAGPMQWRPGRSWAPLIQRLLPFAFFSAWIVAANLAGHAATLAPPPGGSVFTALLTDLEILGRYIVNLVAPLRLSAVYLVEPVRSVTDWRVIYYGAGLSVLAAGTVYMAANRRRAIFGWLWFLGALGPSLNLVAISHLMQDRYLYLSTPGFFLLVTEVAAGLRARFGAQRGPETAPGRVTAGALAAAAYMVALVVLSVLRGGVWRDALTVFSDAVAKQPYAAFARYGLGSAYGELWADARATPGASGARAEAWRLRWLEEWQAGVDRCPDAPRFSVTLMMALNVGEAYAMRGDTEAAEGYWRIAAEKPREAPDDPGVRGAALSKLALLRLEQGRVDDACAFAERALATADEPLPRFARARAVLAAAAQRRRQGDEFGARAMLAQARGDLESITAPPDLRNQAQTMLKRPPFTPQ